MAAATLRASHSGGISFREPVVRMPFFGVYRDRERPCFVGDDRRYHPLQNRPHFFEFLRVLCAAQAACYAARGPFLRVALYGQVGGKGRRYTDEPHLWREQEHVGRGRITGTAPTRWG